MLLFWCNYLVIVIIVCYKVGQWSWFHSRYCIVLVTTASGGPKNVIATNTEHGGPQRHMSQAEPNISNIIYLFVYFFKKILYFVWSPPWHLYIFLLANLLAFYLTYLLAFYLAYLLAYVLAYLLANLSGISSGILSDIASGIFSGILSGISSGIYYDISSGILSGILSSISSGICSGISSGILSGISSGILSGKSSGILSSNFLLHILCPISSYMRSGREHLAWILAVEVRQGTLGVDGRGWGPAGNTGRGWSWLRSGREHWAWMVVVEVRQGTLAVMVVVEVRQGTLSMDGRGWGPTENTVDRGSQLDEEDEEDDEEEEEEEERKWGGEERRGGAGNWHKI